MLIDKGEGDMCGSISRDDESEEEGVFKTLNTILPCDQCDTCALNTPYDEILEVLDE